MKKIVSILLVSVLMFTTFSFANVSAIVLDFYVLYTRTTTSIKLKWTDFSNSCEFDEYDITTRYDVYRKRADNKSKYKLICDDTTALSFRDENLKKNKEYKYVVKAFVYDENNNLLKSFTKRLTVKTKKPTSYKNPKKYISYMTKNEKLKLIEKDFNDTIKFPNASKLKEFKITKYGSGTKTYHNYYGYNAKIEINKKYYNKLVNKFKPLSDSDAEQVYYTNVFKDKIKYCTHFYKTPRSGRLSKNAWIKTVWTSGAIAVIDGKYYLLVNSSFSTATEYFSKNYPDSYF